MAKRTIRTKIKKITKTQGAKAKKPAKKASGLLAAVPKIEKDVLSRKNVDGTVAVMRLDNDEYFFTIDGIAAEAWQLIDGKSSLAAIGSRLLKKHKAPGTRLQQDLSKLVQQLQKEKLVRL